MTIHHFTALLFETASLDGRSLQKGIAPTFLAPAGAVNTLFEPPHRVTNALSGRLTARDPVPCGNTEHYTTATTIGTLVDDEYDEERKNRKLPH